MDERPVVVDTNVLFSALLKSDSIFSEQLLTADARFFICELAVIELFKHKNRIVQYSALPENEILQAYYLLLRRVSLYKEDLIRREIWKQAYTLCKGIDENDTPHVALTLELDGLLWTTDRRLIRGLENVGFDQFFRPGSVSSGA